MFGLKNRRIIQHLGVATLWAAGMGLTGQVQASSGGNKILFVSDRAEKANQDIYSMNPDGTGVKRLTDSSSIDNHPSLSPDGKTVVFSSNKEGGQFEIFKAPLDSIDDESTWVQLTDYEDGEVVKGKEPPARHPHWGPEGNEIIYTAKDGWCHVEEKVKDQCSVPVETKEKKEPFERIHVMNADGTNDRPINLVPIGEKKQNLDRFHTGHPAFGPNKEEIIFTWATENDGSEWETFVVDWDGSNASNPRQITDGSDYPENPNPIRMNGGARFINGDKDIILSSTNTWKGNSELFVVEDWKNKTLPVTIGDEHRLTWGAGNKYVPHQLENDKIAYTSDESENWGNPRDLDIWIMDADGTDQTNLTANPDAVEQLLIPDEVAWFCGLPRNLAPCTFSPRLVSILSFHLMWCNVLSSDFTRRQQYTHWQSVAWTYMDNNYPEYFEKIQHMDQTLHEEVLKEGADGIGALKDPDSAWQRDFAQKQVVIPSLMPPADQWGPDNMPACKSYAAIETNTVPDGTVGEEYSTQLKANLTDFSGKSWKKYAGELPPGLSLETNSPAQLTGTPTEEGTFEFAVAVTDEKGNADSRDFSITVEGPTEYTLTYNAGENGTIAGTTSQTVEEGNDGSQVEAVPDEGYHFTQWSDGNTQNPRTDTNVTADIGVTVSFAINEYTVTFDPGEHGSRSGGGELEQSVEHGGSATAPTIQANTGWKFLDWDTDSTNVRKDLTVVAQYSDNDALPDKWEQQIVDADPNDEIKSIADVNPDDDFDGDGWSNLQEYENDTDPIRYVLELKEGWNLVSIALAPSDYSVNGIFGDKIDKPVWSWSNGRYQQADNLLSTEGYWVRVSSSTEIDIGAMSFPDSPDSDGDGLADSVKEEIGTDPDEYAIRLQPGWNFVSICRVPEDNSPKSIFGDKIIMPVWKWQDGEYQEAEQIEPLKGYWAYCDEEGTTTITVME